MTNPVRAPSAADQSESSAEHQYEQADERICAICQQALSGSPNVAITHTNGDNTIPHVFHVECLNNYRLHTSGQLRCPMCRSPSIIPSFFAMSDLLNEARQLDFNQNIQDHLLAINNEILLKRFGEALDQKRWDILPAILNNPYFTGKSSCRGRAVIRALSEYTDHDARDILNLIQSGSLLERDRLESLQIAEGNSLPPEIIKALQRRCDLIGTLVHQIRAIVTFSRSLF